MTYRKDLRAAPIVVRQARAKLVLVALAAAAFVMLGVAFVCAPAAFVTAEHPAWEVTIAGWACILFFGTCAVFAPLFIWRPTTVVIGPEGVEIMSVFRRYRRNWMEVSGFRIVAIRRTRMVAFNDSRREKRFSAVNRSLIGADATFPAQLSVTPEALLTLVLDAQRRWG